MKDSLTAVSEETWESKLSYDFKTRQLGSSSSLQFFAGFLDF
jgi:hypothetical protein